LFSLCTSSVRPTPLWGLFTLALASACNPDLYISSLQDKVPEPPADVPPAIDDAVPTSSLSVAPTFLDFGDLPTGCLAEQSLWVSNTGATAFDLTEVALEGITTAFSTDPVVSEALPLHLEPGQVAEIVVQYLPMDDARHDNAIMVGFFDSASPEAIVPVVGEGVGSLFLEDSYQQGTPVPVDVLFVVDNSGSMAGDLRALAEAFDGFMTAFIDLDLDYHIGVVTTDMVRPAQSGRLQGDVITPSTADPIDAFGDQTARGTSGSGHEEALLAVQTALSEDLLTTDNQGFRREDADLAIAVVSDEDDESDIDTLDFTSWLAQQMAPGTKASFSAAVGPDGDGLGAACGPTGPIVAEAPRYHELLTQLPGVWADLCYMDFHPFLQHLAYTAAGLQVVFPVSEEPAGDIEVFVDGVLVEDDAGSAWTYNPALREITFFGDAIPGPGAEVVLSYEAIGVCPAP
jgi:hypothetical protein